jgi:glycosyltransferase involved in cell wall biosynthesis
MTTRLALVTGGHLSTCPRMLKAADALADAGYEVTVISTRSTTWAAKADEDVSRRRPGCFRWIVVDYSRGEGLPLYARSGIRRKVARARATRKDEIPFRLATHAFTRVHDELAEAAIATGADFFYGGTTGGVAAAFVAAERTGRNYGLDLEDFYSGEPIEGSLDQKLAERIEREILPRARFLTASSEAIAAAYREKYGVTAETVHNVFPLPERAPDLEALREGPLRLYWFSQTIGPGRGLEEAMVALARSGVEAELHLRGVPHRSMRELIDRWKFGGLTSRVHAPGLPDEMTLLACGYDIGLSLEPGHSQNNRIALGNKVLTYIVAGLAVAMTATPGQRPIREALGDHALVAPMGDVNALAEGFRRFARDRVYLRECRKASWQAAAARWHWEHADERGKLLRLFEAATRQIPNRNSASLR